MDALELLGCDGSQVHALGQVPAQETNDIFDGAFLPRGVWITEEDRQAEGLPLRVLRSTIEREGAPECFLESAQALCDRALCVACGLVPALRE